MYYNKMNSCYRTPKLQIEDHVGCASDAECKQYGITHSDTAHNGAWCQVPEGRARGECRMCPWYCDNAPHNGQCHTCRLEQKTLTCGPHNPLVDLACNEVQIIKTAADFATCFVKEMLPQGGSDPCIADLKASIESCHDPEQHCSIAIGMNQAGQLTSCLDIERGKLLARSFKKQWGPLKVEGSIGPTGKIGVHCTLDTDPQKVELEVKLEKVGLKASLVAQFDFTKGWPAKRALQEELSPQMKILMKTVMVGYIPIVIVVHAQLFAYIDYGVVATANSGSVAASINAFVGVDDAVFRIRHGEHPFWESHAGARITSDVKSALNPSITLDAFTTLRIGVRLTMTVEGVPFVVEPALRIHADGDFSTSANCDVFGTSNVDMAVDYRAALRLPDAGALADTSCAAGIALLHQAANWAIDADTTQVPPAQYLAHSNVSKGMLIHAGFQSAYSALRPALRKTVAALCK